MTKAIEIASAAAMFLTLSVAAYAAGPAKELSGRAWIARAPMVPDDAFQAYKQWTEVDGNLQPGPELQALESDLRALSMGGAGAGEPGAQAEGLDQARAQQLAAEFDSPEGEERLQHMTPAQMQALAQAMRGAIPAAVSPGSGLQKGESVALKDIAAMTDAGNAAAAGVTAIHREVSAVHQQWIKEDQELGYKEAAAIDHLPLCHGQAGMPSTAAVGRIHLEFADQKISLASRFLKKLVPLQQKMRAAVTPEADACDQAQAAFKRLRSPGALMMAKPQMGAVGPRVALDVSNVYQIAKEASEHAAKAVARKRSLQKQYEHAPGC